MTYDSVVMSDHPIMKRIWERTEPIPECGCYVWMGALKGSGYGSIRIDGKLWATHKVARELLIGPVPEGLELDHKCRIKSCWNPAHLEPVTHKKTFYAASVLLPLMPAKHIARTGTNTAKRTRT